MGNTNVKDKLDRTHAIIEAAREKSKDIATIPSCDRCVWREISPKEYQSGDWEYCRQPLVADLKVNDLGKIDQRTVFCTSARENEDLCGRRGDLFVAKTWWEMNRYGIYTILYAIIAMAIVIGVLSALVVFLGIPSFICIAFCILIGSTGGWRFRDP